MGMGIVSDAELQEELRRNPPPKIIISQQHGRNNGDRNVPESLRKVIAEDYIENGAASAAELADNFGISRSSVSAYSRGATSTTTYHEADAELKKHILGVKDKIAGKARRRLKWALNGITESKLAEASLKTASAVAKDMAVIIKTMEPPPESETQRNTNVQVVLFAPKVMDENDFQRIKVKE